MCGVAANHMLCARQIRLPDRRIHKACGVRVRQSMRESAVKEPEKNFSKPEKTSKSLSGSVPETFGSDLALERYLDGKNY